MSNSAGGRGSRGLSRVSIPDITRETIQNIKEIAGNHSDDEVYAVLRECSMDPNETAQKLLFQDTFHEVKRKRDKRKENVSIKEPITAGRRFAIQGWGGRSGRGNYSSHCLSHDASFAKNPSADREIVANQCLERTKTSIPQCIEKNSSLASNSISGIAHGPSDFTSAASFHGGSSSQNLTTEINNFQSSSLQENISIKNDQNHQIANTYESCVSNMDQSSSSLRAESEAYSPVSDPVVEPSLDFCITGVLGTQKTDVDHNNDTSASLSDRKSLDAISLKTHSYISDNPSDISQAYESNNHPDEFHVRPTSSCTSGSRPPSNYSNRSQQLSGSKKVVPVVPVKVWKPKHTNTNTNNVHTSEKLVTSNVPDVATVTSVSNQSSEETTSKLQKRLDELHFSDDRHVFFPSHIQVPVSERALLNFGSFTTSVVDSNNELSDKNSPLPSSESPQKLEENVEESSSSIENDSPTTEDDDVHPQSSEHSRENLSSDEAEISDPSTGQGCDEPHQGSTLASVELQHSVIHTAPIYSTIGLIPSTVGMPFTAFESSESQTYDTSQPSDIVVQHPFDSSANHYTQVYHTGAEGDGRYSPFYPTGATIKYNTALSSNTDLSQQEGVNSVIQSTPGPPIVAQTVTQPPLPVFRQPAGVHISHYPSNYIPYNPYFSPFYIPPHSVHPYLSNAAFPHQHPIAPIYSPMAAAAPIKYPVSQFKTGTNSTHTPHVGLPTGYGPYNSNLTGYSPNSAPNTVNSASNDDLAASQYKDNMYLSVQQSEGSNVWIPTPGRDVIGLQANSFYNLPQGQHVAFTPTQAGHGAFPGIFHPTQMASTAVHPLLHQSQTVAGAVDTVNHQTGVYPPPQRPPINWANNY